MKITIGCYLVSLSDYCFTVHQAPDIWLYDIVVSDDPLKYMLSKNNKVIGINPRRIHYPVRSCR